MLNVPALPDTRKLKSIAVLTSGGDAPGMNAAIAKAFVEQRPFASIVDANKFLLGQKLTQEQLTAVYAKAFVPVADKYGWNGPGESPELSLIMCGAMFCLANVLMVSSQSSWSALKASTRSL